MIKRTLQYGDTLQFELEFGNVGFFKRGENKNTRGKTSRSKDENQQQTQPTYDAESGNRTRATLVGGECSHHCAIPALLQKGLLREPRLRGVRRS